MIKLKPDSRVHIRAENCAFSSTATVLKVENCLCYVKPDSLESDITMKKVIISDGSISYHAIVKEQKDNELVLDILAEDRRSFFRIDDAFPIKVRKVSKKPSLSRFLAFYPRPVSQQLTELDTDEEGLLPLLQDINNKLDFLINILTLHDEGLHTEESRAVNISASGVRLEIEEKVEVGDLVELKMLLPLCPPVAILTFGEVVRVKEKKKDGKVLYETALVFTGLTEEVQEEIIHYTLKRQREIIRRQRERE